MRVKRGVKARRRRNRILNAASGYYGARSRTFRNAIAQVHSGWSDAYRHRKEFKRDMRKLWILRINAAVREHGLSYSKFINLLSRAEIDLDRKALAELAYNQPEAFADVVAAAKQAA